MLNLSPTRRRAERAEAYVARYAFPPSLMRRVAAAHPELRPDELRRVEEGLREWLICCIHRRGALLGMPSQAVDWAWHEFILNTPAYHEFCRRAYGEYLHHLPESDMSVSMGQGLEETVLAWDRSAAREKREAPSLWNLDEGLGLEDPTGVSPELAARARRAARDANRHGRRGSESWMYMAAGADGHGGGDGGGGGCGGGGCGGGG
jgi:hypothetical protein